MPDYVVEELGGAPGDEIIELLAAAYVVNDMHKAIFPGGDEICREGNLKMFRMGAPGMPGTWLCVREAGNVIGIIHFVPYPECVPPESAKEERGRAMVKMLGIEVARRVGEWRKSWDDAHPAEPHWHLGPIATAPERQRQGIGSALMKQYCRRMDAVGATGYLETDVPRNVPFYEKSGFRIVGQADALGARSWFMKRAPGTI
jgi:GNAT superfamily N-acetyltransferase